MYFVLITPLNPNGAGYVDWLCSLVGFLGKHELCVLLVCLTDSCLAIGIFGTIVFWLYEMSLCCVTIIIGCCC